MTLTDRDLQDLEKILGGSSIVECYKFTKDYVYKHTVPCANTGKMVYVGNDRYLKLYKNLEHYLKVHKHGKGR